MSRREEISNLYLSLLKREPDLDGLENYLNSSFTIQEIAEYIRDSSEYENLERAGIVKPTVVQHLQKTVLYSSEHMLIDYYQQDTPSNDLVFSFNGLPGADFNLNNRGYFGKHLIDFKYDVVFFKITKDNFYEELTPEILEKVLSQITRTYTNKLAIGFCMGGFGIVKSSKTLGIDRALMFAPSNKNLSDVYFYIDKDLISPDCQFYACCNYNNPTDKQSFDYICSIIPRENITKIRCDDNPTVHGADWTLRRAGFSELCKEILESGTVPENPLIIIDKE